MLIRRAFVRGVPLRVIMAGVGRRDKEKARRVVGCRWEPWIPASAGMTESLSAFICGSVVSVNSVSPAFAGAGSLWLRSQLSGAGRESGFVRNGARDIEIEPSFG
jgi:hypothetical protein